MNWFARFLKKSRTNVPAQIFFTNTLSGKKEVFVPRKPGLVHMYTCGPTVYAPAHIGNLRAYVFSDTIARTLIAAGYHVRRVINITDVGHLVSDGDEGEDKMTKGLLRENLPLTLENMRTLAEKYTTIFLHDLDDLHIDTASITFPRASDYIQEQIALIATLEQKGYAYRTKEGVYFDTARFSAYGKLGNINLSAQESTGRAKANKEKRHPADFVLWRSDPSMGWESPWGRGFPGWHIECSAMSRSLLGQELDIHTGGEDHIAVHHNNEIAQSEAATGRTFVHYWMHAAFLTMSGEKASKSLGNVVYLSDVMEKCHALALRYFFLQAHYRTPLSFSWEALASASEALTRLWKISAEIAKEADRKSEPSEARVKLVATLRDDLGTPQALGILWESLKSEEYTPEEKWGLLEDAEAHLGLSLLNPPEVGPARVEEIPSPIADLLLKRESARQMKDFEEADRIREEIEKSGYLVEDRPGGPILTEKPR